MPSLDLPSVPHYVPARPTEADLDYADLTVIDLSKADTLEGRKELTVQLLDAMKTQGVFYAVNHGYTQSQTDRMFDIANLPFENISLEELKQYQSKITEDGSYQGYKPREFWHIDAGVRDQLEHYNLNHDVTRREHPKALRPFLPEIDAFARHCHFNVLHPLLRLFALGLELPEETFVNLHGFENIGESFVRFMKYHPRCEEDEQKTKNVWLKGHTDIGGVTILWSQPVAALQILSRDGKWRWIKHIDNALIVNTGDTLDFLSGGFYEPTIHRVVQPPPDQRNKIRLSLVYFTLPHDGLKLLPRVESPVLQRVGIHRRFEDKDAPMMEDWRRSRTAAYGVSKLTKVESGHEEEVVEGIVVKHYN